LSEDLFFWGVVWVVFCYDMNVAHFQMENLQNLFL